MAKNNIYPITDANPDFARLEEKIQKYWHDNNIFKQSVENRSAKKEEENNEYVFYDGPPFANGLPHYGHLLTGFVKDIFARYQTQIGKRTERKFGWDTHGLPVEMETEKELKVSGRNAIEEYGIAKFNDACETSVMKYAGQWQEYVNKQARWVDFEGGYKTMDLNYMESVMWAFKELHNKGLIYEDLRVMPYSWSCQTPLSNFETRLDNSYREKESKAVTLGFELPEIKAKILVWTTTPWTLPSNLALAVGADIDYIRFSYLDQDYIIAKSLLKKYKKELPEEKLIIKDTFKGKDLIGIKYKPLFDCLVKDNKKFNLESAFKIYGAEFVTTEDGTGIVHIAPGFGEDDQELCKRHNIPTICPVDEAGCFVYPVTEFEGRHVFDTNIDIIKKLKEQGSWLKTEQYIHNYPHCWRSDTPLIYKAMPSWYVRVTDFKDRMVELNQEINWIPGHVKDGSFGKWLEGARDWSISRNRFWGCPVPIWRSNDPKYPRLDVYGSIAELERDFGTKITNLHRPFIDDLTRVNPDDPTGKSMMVRVTDVLDCWFESGSMPYAQSHYPFENKAWFEEHFPADFIVEYTAQTRGWFYTLMVLSTALFDRVPFKNCICHGVILDEKSQKLSKRLKNYISPLDIFAKYGSDAMRFFMGSSPVMKGNELNIDKGGEVFRESLRLSIKPIWNSYNFFCIYANADNIKAEYILESSNEMDNYILSKLKDLVVNIKFNMDNYDLPNSYAAIDSFFDILNNWYIRRNRDRFWQKEINNSKLEAYNTLYTVLNIVTRAVAPLIPHLAEEIFQGIEQKNLDSVHLQDYPELNSLNYKHELVEDMDKIRSICTTAHSLRSKHNIRTRQPILEVKIIGASYLRLEKYSKLICDEINVKNISFIKEIGNLAELKLDLKFKVLGARYGAKTKEIISAAKKGEWLETKEGKIQINNIILADDEYELALKAKSSNMQSLSSHDALIAIETNLTQELIEEGLARDLVRLIQQQRKELDFDITDKIIINLSSSSAKIEQVLNSFIEYIKEQTLAESILLDDKVSDNAVKIDDVQVSLEIKKY